MSWTLTPLACRAWIRVGISADAVLSVHEVAGALDPDRDDMGIVGEEAQQIDLFQNSGDPALLGHHHAADAVLGHHDQRVEQEIVDVERDHRVAGERPDG